MNPPKNYQNLNKYNGSLHGNTSYNGLEYDWETPDDTVIGSPGGVSSIHHHYTKGFYGRGNTSSDIYAGQGERYNNGVYGSLYKSGHTASEALGMYPPGPDQQYWNASTQETKIENFSSNNLSSQGIELIESNDAPINETGVSSKTTPLKYRMSTWLIFILFLVAFVAFAFWASTSQEFVRQYLHQGKRVKWQALLIYSVIITALFIIIAWLTGVPLTLFEQV